MASAPTTVVPESYDCDECNRSFDTERGRDSHIDQVHGRPWQDGELLHGLYVGRRLSSMEIAARFGISDATVRNNLKANGIEIRSTAESLQNHTPDAIRDPIRLRELYVDEGLTDREIAERYDVGQPTVTRWRNEHGIDARPNPAGEDHPSWKPDTGQITYGRGWDAKRRAARKRDDNTCQACGYTPDDGNLDVHHIRRVEDYDAPGDAHELTNLVTLCRSCHRRWEGIPVRPTNEGEGE